MKNIFIVLFVAVVLCGCVTKDDSNREIRQEEYLTAVNNIKNHGIYFGRIESVEITKNTYFEKISTIKTNTSSVSISGHVSYDKGSELYKDGTCCLVYVFSVSDPNKIIGSYLIQ